MAITTSIRHCLLGASTAAMFSGIFANVAMADSSAADDQGPKLEEIVVTAQKRVENLQNVPISAQVVSNQVLTQQNLNSLTDLVQTTPAVNIVSAGRSNQLFIRGIGSPGSNQSYDQSVSTFVDDIYYGRSRTTAGTFLDLDHIEILKGPQSTFFGNNAIAGAFNIVTQKPTDSFDASARALYGQFGQYAAEGAIGGPITDTLSVRVAGIYDGQQGWLKDLNTGDHEPAQRNLAGRATLLFKPIEDLDATLKIEGSTDKSVPGIWSQLDDCPPHAPFKAAAGFCKSALSLNVPIGLANNQTSQPGGQLSQLSSAVDVLTVNYRHWNQTFTSVSGYYHYDYNLNWAIAGLPTNELNAQVPEEYRQFSQEFRVASPTDQTIQYLAGLYFQVDHLTYATDESFFFLTPTLRAIGARPPFSALVPYLPIGQADNADQEEHVFGVFGSASWNVTEQLKITAGLRGTQVNKDFSDNLFYGTATQSYGGIVSIPSALQALPAALGLGKPGPIDGLTRSDHAWLPSANVRYDFDSNVMGYLSYAKGFKSGGFNGADTTGIAANIPFAPEYVEAYEAGVKSEWLNRRLLFNVALFLSNYKDQQVSSTIFTSQGTPQSVVNNAASSRSEGVEFETQWVIDDHFRLSADGTYLDSYYVNYVDGGPTVLQQYQGLKVQNLSGQQRPYAPKWSGNLAADYTTPLPGNLRFTAELSPYFTSNYYLNILDQWSGAYTRLDGRLTLQSADQRWSVDLIGKNLTSRTILLTYFAVSTASGSALDQREAPRNVALQFRYRWK
jgi:iron complex outermembrane receptor protein